jgi:hypothetical protein
MYAFGMKRDEMKLEKELSTEEIIPECQCRGGVCLIGA